MDKYHFSNVYRMATARQVESTRREAIHVIPPS